MTIEAGKYYWVEESAYTYAGVWMCEVSKSISPDNFVLGRYVSHPRETCYPLYPNEIKREATSEEIMRAVL